MSDPIDDEPKPAYPTPPVGPSSKKTTPDEARLARMSANYREGWQAGTVEGTVLALVHLRETLDAPAGKPMRGERQLLGDLRRRFGDRLVDAELQRRGYTSAMSGSELGKPEGGPMGRPAG